MREELYSVEEEQVQKVFLFTPQALVIIRVRENLLQDAILLIFLQ